MTRTRAAALSVKAKPTSETFGRARLSARRALGVRAKADSLMVGWPAAVEEAVD